MLLEAGLPAECIQLVPVTDREAVGYMLAGMTDYLSKPILAQDLKAKLQQLFGSTSALDIATPVSSERGI